MTFRARGRNVTGQSMYTSVGRLVLGLSYFSQDVFSGSFYRYLFAAAFCRVRAKNDKETASHTHGQLSTHVALDHRVDPTSDSTSELVICAVSAPASRLAELPPADKAHSWGSESVSRGCDPRGCVVCCWCLLLPKCFCCAELLLLLQRRLLLFFTFSHISC